MNNVYVECISKELLHKARTGEIELDDVMYGVVYFKHNLDNNLTQQLNEYVRNGGLYESDPMKYNIYIIATKREADRRHQAWLDKVKKGF